MRNYENLVIIKPTLTEEETLAQVALIDEILTANGATITTCDKMGMRPLAYQIEKNSRGYYYVVYYTAAPTAIAEIERRFRINEELLRFVTMKYESKREVAAWQKMVDAANKKSAAKIAAATPAPVVETPATEAPATEAPAAEATTEA